MRRVFGEKDKIVAGHEKHPDVTTRHDKKRALGRVVSCSASSQGRGRHPEILF
jgi:hypothetical protein